MKLTHKEEKGSNMEAGGTEHRMRLALSWFLKAAEVGPMTAENHAYVGNAYFRLDELQEARVAYQRAVALDPKEARYHSNLGSVLAQKGLYSQALESFHAAKVLSPNDGTLSKNYDSTEMFLRFDQMVEELKGATAE